MFVPIHLPPSLHWRSGSGIVFQMNIYLRVKQLEKFLPVIASGLVKKGRNDNITEGTICLAGI